MNRREYQRTDCWLALLYGDRVPLVRQEYHGSVQLRGDSYNRRDLKALGYTVKVLCRVGTRPCSALLERGEEERKK